MVLLGLVVMVLGSFASTSMTTWAGVMTGRLVAGAGAVLLLVLMTKMAFDWFAGTSHLFMAMSIFIVGWPVGHALGQSALTLAAEHGGWAWAFHGAAIACTFAAMLLAAAYRPPAGAAERTQESLSSLTRREFQLTTLAGLLWMIANGAYVLVLGLGPAALLERGVSPIEAATAASLMPWAFLVALPLGAWVATHWSAPNGVMGASLAGSAVLGIWLALDAGAAAFLAFGFAMALGVATMAALPSEALREEMRSVGLGWYFVWYFIGSAAFPALGGWISEVSGTAAWAMGTAAISMAVCVGLLVAFRVVQRGTTPQVK
jgi:MFS family permease